MSRSQINRRPPWEVLSLVAQLLDPKTLAVASCVSKSWFDINVDYGSFPVAETLEEVKITWNVVLRGWQGVFMMIDREEKLNLRAGSGGWFSDSLPSPGCCSSEMAASGIVADLKLGFCRMRERDGKIRVDK
ncbi:hypothetical protein Dsin_011938, partial [Dipteronia sinensis]